MGMVVYSRFEVWWINLNPTIGSEINKKRPCVIISPDDLNHSKLKTIIVAPMTTTKRDYPTRVDVEINNKKGQVALDQIRTIDKSRLENKLSSIDENRSNEILEILQEMFSL